jgi:hypothetical protein
MGKIISYDFKLNKDLLWFALIFNKNIKVNIVMI